jgi:hypothetical protein
MGLNLKQLNLILKRRTLKSSPSKIEETQKRFVIDFRIVGTTVLTAAVRLLRQ